MHGSSGLYFIVAIDTEGFSTLADSSQRVVRDVMYQVAQEAVADIHLDWDPALVKNEGDGLIMLFRPDVPPVLLVGDMLRALDRSLAEKHLMLSESHRLRLRVAVHQGLVDRDPNGWSGKALIRACRLLDSELLRSVLRASARANIAVMVSAELHEAVIAPGHRSVDPASFLPAVVDLKGQEGVPVWVHVPGYPAPLGLTAGSGRTVPGRGAPGGREVPDDPQTRDPRPRRGDRDAAGASVTVAGGTVGNLFIGDQVIGNKVVHIDGDGSDD